MRSKGDVGARFGRRTFASLVGQGLPGLVALVAVPKLIHLLGNERFGFLGIAFAVIGYFGLFDFGVSRAMTKQVAEAIGHSDPDRAGSIARTGLRTMTWIGLVGSIVLMSVAAPTVRDWLRFTPSIRDEALTGWIMLAVGLPPVIRGTGCRGVLEAHQQFELSAGITGIAGVLTFLAPWAVARVTPNLTSVVGSIVAVRYLQLAAQEFAVRRCGYLDGELDSGHVPALLTYGGWITLSALVSPVMLYVDRFVIGHTLNMSSVVFYTTPHDAITRLMILPAAVGTVLFPTFSRLKQTDSDVPRMFRRGVAAGLLCLAPFALVLCGFGHFLLLKWLNADFAARSTPIVVWLVLGILGNAMSAVAYAFVQGANRPDITAKFHLIELPIYFGLLWMLLGTVGVVGAAIAWTTRVYLDLILLYYAALKIRPDLIEQIAPIALGGLMLVTGVAWLGLVDVGIRWVGPLPAAFGAYLLFKHGAMAGETRLQLSEAAVAP